MTPERWRRVQELFLAAAELGPAERAALLAEGCGDDDALRGEVERMLAADEEPQPLLDRAPLPPGPALEPAGRLVGPYRIVRELGRGGMGTVYLAEREDVGKRVALKLVRGALAAPENLERFLLERRVLARLEHPNIAALLDAGVAEDGTPYFAMEYVRGEPIDRYFDIHRLDTPERLALFETLCAAVAHAHALRVVHRDLKPSNILVTDPDTFDAGGRVKLLDFGIAKVIEEGAVSRGLTRTGAHPMTPEYAAPEQEAGGPVTPATDVYALGILLRRLLGGPRADRSDMVAPNCADDRLGADLDRIVRRAMAAEPAERYASAAELLAELRGARSGEGEALPARPIAPRQGARRGLRRPARWVLALLVLVLALAGVSTRLRAPSALTRDHTVAVLPFTYRGAAEYAYLSEGLVSLLSTNLDGIDGLRAVAPRALHGMLGQQANSEASRERLARRLGAALYVTGDVLEAGGRLRIDAALHDSDGRVLARGTVAGAGSELFTLLEELTARLLAGRWGDSPLARSAALTTHSLPALRAYLEGERALRAGHFAAAVEAFERAVAVDSAFGLAHYRLSTASVWTGRATLALPSAQRAARLAGRLDPIDSLRVAGWLNYLAGDPIWAAHQFGRITASRPDDVDAWFQLGEVLYHWMPTLGRPATEARDAFERVLQYEPGNRGALIHLARIAALEGRVTELDSLSARLRRLEPEGALAREAQALHAFARRDSAEQRRIAAGLAADASGALPVVTSILAAGLDPLPAAAWARDLARSASSPAQRNRAYVLAALALAAAGRSEAASAELHTFASATPQAAHELRAALLLAPLLAPSREQLAAAHAALARVPQAEKLLELPVSDFHLSPFPPVRLYLLGMLGLRLGDATSAQEDARRLERWQGSDRDRRWAQVYGRLLRAEVLRGERRFEEALRLLDAPQVPPDSLLPALLSHPGAHERWLRAELLRELGQEREALRWYATFPNPTAYDLVYLAPAHLRRAELHERHGEREQAIEHYRRFIELWREPDPEQQPQVTRARQRLAAFYEAWGRPEEAQRWREPR